MAKRVKERMFVSERKEKREIETERFRERGRE